MDSDIIGVRTKKDSKFNSDYSDLTPLYLETINETEFAPSTKDDSFIPNVFVYNSKNMKDNIKIINVYKKEIGQHPFPRNGKNIRALATLRGAISGCEYAESFMLLKEII